MSTPSPSSGNHSLSGPGLGSFSRSGEYPVVSNPNTHHPSGSSVPPPPPHPPLANSNSSINIPASTSFGPASSNGFHSSSAAERAQLSRMGWLYSMISSHGSAYEYRDASREWIKRRCMKADVTARRDRQHSLWWEERDSAGHERVASTGLAVAALSTPKAVPPIHPGLVTPTSKGVSMLTQSLNTTTTVTANTLTRQQIAAAAAAAVAARREEERNSQSAKDAATSSSPRHRNRASRTLPPPLPQSSSSPPLPPASPVSSSSVLSLTLEEVLQSPSLRMEFYSWLEENFAASCLDFLMAVERWKAKCFDGHGSLKDLDDEHENKVMTIHEEEEDDDDDEEDDDGEKESVQKPTNHSRGGSVPAGKSGSHRRERYLEVLGMAQRIYEQFLSNEATETSDNDALTVSDETKSVLRKALQFDLMAVASASSSSSLDGSEELSENIFSQSVEEVHAFLRENWWTLFTESDEYQNLLEERREELAEKEERERREKQTKKSSVGPPPLPASYLASNSFDSPQHITNQSSPSVSALSITSASSINGNGNSNGIPNGPLSPLSPTAGGEERLELPPTLYETFVSNTRAPAWINKNGYAALVIDLLELRLMKQEKRTYVHISVDSRSLRSKDATYSASASPNPPPYCLLFNDRLIFPLCSTTQSVEFSFYTSSGRFLGRVFQPMAWIYAKQADYDEKRRGEPREPELLKLSKPYEAGSSGSHATLMSQSASGNLSENELVARLTLRRERVNEDSGEDDHEQIFDSEIQSGVLSDAIRGKVSKKKKRFQLDGFDLDLSYITERIIAMGFPSMGTEGMYRNPMVNVQRFFSRRHPKAFKLYNLCSERSYPASKFEDRCAVYPFDDHNPCPFEIVKQFCEDVRTWLAEHPQNVAAIHCKAGKGRTGMMIACYLLYSGVCTEADEALTMFAERRTKNKKGVTIPSQIRWVHYFAQWCKIKRSGGVSPGQTTLFLQGIRLVGVPKAASGSELDVYFTINHAQLKSDEREKPKFSSLKYECVTVDKEKKVIVFDLSKKLLPMSDDVKLEFAVKSTMSTVKLFQFWINSRWEPLLFSDETGNTNFHFTGSSLSHGLNALPIVLLQKMQIDKACKDTKHKRYPAEMRVELIFAPNAVAAANHQLYPAATISP